MAVWLFVERMEHWQIDEAEGFARFGLSPAAAKRAAEIQAGDRLVFYISSGVSAFSDIREALSGDIEKLRFGGDYDTAYPYAIRTRPVLVLPRTCWLPMREIAPSLDAFSNRDWRQMMRATLRRMSDTDGKRLIHAIEARLAAE